MPLGSLFPLLVHLHYAGGAGHNAVVELVFFCRAFSIFLCHGNMGASGTFFNVLLMAVIGGVCFFLIRKYDCKTEK